MRVFSCAKLMPVQPVMGLEEHWQVQVRELRVVVLIMYVSCCNKSREMTYVFFHAAATERGPFISNSTRAC